MIRVALLILLLIPAQLLAEQTESSESALLTPEQTMNIRSISDLQLAPDEQRIAFTVAEPMKGTAQDRNVWILDIEAGKSYQLTFSEKADSSPRWSPDGATLAFLSRRSGPPKIFLLPMRGGEGQPLTEIKSAVQRFEWSPDGKKIAFMATEPKSEEEEKKEKDKDDARVVDQDDRLGRLWVIDVASREEQQITKGAWRVSEFTWLPDGDSLLVSATDDPQPELETDALYSVNVRGGDMVKISEPMRPFGRLRLSPDGKNLAYVGNGRDGPNPFDLFVQPAGGGSGKNLSGSSIDRSISGFAWRNKSTLLASVGTGFETTFFEIGLDGTANALDGGKVPSAGSFVAGSGFVAFVGQNATQAPDIWILRGADEPKQVTQLNSSWNELTLVEIEVFRYPSFDGKEIEAALLRPDGSGNGPFPLVAMIHGGPSGRWARRFNSWGQLLVARGFAVFYPNIRGSTGYGHDFLVSNRRDWGGGDFKDVMAGIDHLVSEGIADPDRLGIGGWSYGGYMAAWAVTQTDRFKASIPGAPMTDLALEYGAETAGINAYDTWYMGNPYEDLDLFMERSPTTHIRKVRTPTLILCGENDVIDPIAQCQQFHRGLKRFGVETEFVRYPREGHGIREEKHQLDLLNRVIEWYETHLE